MNTLVVRAAAWTSVGLLTAIAALHGFWAGGGVWTLHAVSGGALTSASTGTRIFFAVVGVVALFAIPVVMDVAGLERGGLPIRTERIALWTMAALLALGGLVRVGAAPLVGATALVLAALFTLVALAKEA
jgi:hypothetical protein